MALRHRVHVHIRQISYSTNFQILEIIYKLFICEGTCPFFKSTRTVHPAVCQTGYACFQPWMAQAGRHVPLSGHVHILNSLRVQAGYMRRPPPAFGLLELLARTSTSNVAPRTQTRGHNGTSGKTLAVPLTGRKTQPRPWRSRRRKPWRTSPGGAAAT